MGYFPWNRLPKELRVNVLRHLTRTDLDNCHLLNRETFELIRRNEKFMKRRIIEFWDIQIYQINEECSLQMFGICSEVGIWRETLIPWGCSILPKLLKNATIQFLAILYRRVTDKILWSISSCLLNVDCQVQKLAIVGTSVAAVTSSVFLEFLRKAAPTLIHISGIRDCSYDNFSPEVLEFIVTRPKFGIFAVSPEPFLMDDDILANVTASVFTIGATTRITADGIKSFVGGLASGKHELVRGKIRILSSPDSLRFPTSSNVAMSVITEERDSVPFLYVVITATTRKTAKLKTC
uniref:F-box domain-containing protein n=1 Tax=Haemonchus contortus TaxID=6289 RepID=A0A7I5E8D6_HAECO